MTLAEEKTRLELRQLQIKNEMMLREMVIKTEWNDAHFSIPKDDIGVLVLFGPSNIEVAHFHNGAWRSSLGCGTNILGVTHWMPLPNPPEVK